MDDPHTLLAPDQLAAAGLSGFAYGYSDKVRFYELDALNHVNNTVFLKWFETIRVNYALARGITTYSHADDDPQLVVRHLSADFLAPMYQNEVYTIAARTRSIKASSLIMEYAVASGGQIKGTGDCVIISLEQDGKTRRAHFPDAVRAMVDLDGAKLVS
ncbi:acyl-CoA thioesterase [Boseongicola aestuarii]|jgi:acyl-CoA thioester hydrolase|uniref:acyl-CoA thioesterase n=1 Tax=Boseongicola aestuarii TaxID=1470561 RepID=UPI000BB45583|nr:thioesterase family protein [Boseongicola aestuarii]